MDEGIRERAQRWCAAVSDAAFCGGPSRYEESYEQLLAEVGKLESLHSDGTPDWDVVYRCADALLLKSSKDMTVLGALCIALLERDGLAGLAAGLEAYRWLIEQHGKAMFPSAKRRRGRVGAYTWLTRQLEQRLEGREANGADVGAYEASAAAFAGLDQLMRLELSDQHPRVRPVQQALERLIEQAKVSSSSASAPVAQPELAAPTHAPRDGAQRDDDAGPSEAEGGTIAEAVPARAPARAPAPSAAIENDDQAQAVLEHVIETIARLASYHLGADRSRSIGYQLAHLASTIGVVPDGDRMPSEPAPKVALSITQAIDDQDFGAVIETVQKLADDKTFSINIQHIIAGFLERVGDRAAAQVVTSQAREFAQRMDGSISVGNEARAWLESGPAPAPARPQRAAPAAPAPSVERRARVDLATDESTSAPRAGGDVEAARAAELAEAARRTTEAHGLDEGCRELRSALRRAGTQSLRFHLRLAMARLCADEGAADLARPLLQDLRVELDDPIRQWAPALLVDVCTATLACNRQLERIAEAESVRAELERETAEMMTILARVAPDVAFRERMK